MPSTPASAVRRLRGVHPERQLVVEGPAPGQRRGHLGDAVLSAARSASERCPLPARGCRRHALRLHGAADRLYVPQGIAWTTKASNATTTWKWSGQVTYNALYSPDAPHGFYWVQLKAIHAVGRVKFKLKGLHSDYKAHSQNPPYAFGLTFAPPFAGTSQCSEARFPGPAPAPSCTLTTSRLVCK